MADRAAVQEEKMQAALNRFIDLKRQTALGELVRRPTNPLDIDNLQQCEEWREQVLYDVAKHIEMIQNGGLGNHKIRDLNDLINKLVREKSLWEDRIRQLGGPDYKHVTVRQIDEQGQELPGASGYYYFGAAKDLPGVRDLFVQAPPSSVVNSKEVLLTRVNESYWVSQEDPELLAAEAAAEAEMIQPIENFDEHEFHYLIKANKAWLESQDNL